MVIQKFQIRGVANTAEEEELTMMVMGELAMHAHRLMLSYTAYLDFPETGFFNSLLRQGG